MCSLKTFLAGMGAAIAVLVAGCAKPQTALNGRGFGGEDTVASAMVSDRTRGVNVIDAYLNQGDPNNHLCDASLVQDEPFLKTTLGALASDTTGAIRASLESTMMGRAELTEWRNSLLAATMSITDNPQDVMFQGVQQDALTVGLNITFLRSSITPMTDYRRIALELHEGSHAETSGWLDYTMIGILMGRQAIDLRAACFVALLRYLEAQSSTTAPVASTPPVVDFVDEFNTANGTNIGSSWTVTTQGVTLQTNNGLLVPSNAGVFGTLLTGLTRQDVRLQATADFACVANTSGCWLDLIARANSTRFYAVGISSQSGQMRPSIAFCDGANCTQLATGNAIALPTTGSLEYDVDFRVSGQNISVNVAGYTLSAVNAALSTAGQVGFRGSNIALDRVEVDDP